MDETTNIRPGGAWVNGRAIRLLFLANFISGVAQGISMIAIPWYFAQQGDGTRFGYIYAVITAFSLFWGPYSGTLVDKYDRRKIFLILNVVLATLLLAVAYHGFQQGGLPWGIVGLVYLATFLNYNIHYPNLYAFLQEITQPRHYGKITSYIEIQGQLASVLAGAGAALLLEGTREGQFQLFAYSIAWVGNIEPWPIHQIFLVDGLTYVLGFCILWLIRYQALALRHPESGKVSQRLKMGFHFLRENPYLFVFGIASYSLFACILVTIFYVNPLYVENYLEMGGDVFASAEMSYAIGAIFAGLAIRRVFRERFLSIRKSIIIMALLSAAMYAVLSWNTHLGLYFLLLLVLGCCNAGTRIQRVTYLFRHIPNQFYGRANSIFFVTNVLSRIVLTTLFALPFFQHGGNIAHSMGVMAVFLLLSAGVLAFMGKREPK